MRIVITGGGGFLGQRVAAALLARGGLAQAPGSPAALTEIVLVDQAMPEHGVSDARIRKVVCDITDHAFIGRLFAPPVDAVFHFAAVVSAGAEADFDLGYRVNLDATRLILEACRPCTIPRFRGRCRYRRCHKAAYARGGGLRCFPDTRRRKGGLTCTFFGDDGLRACLTMMLLLHCTLASAAVNCDQLGNLALATEQYRNEGVPLQVLLAETDKLSTDGNMTKDDLQKIRKTVQESYDRTRTPLEIRKECKDIPAK